MNNIIYQGEDAVIAGEVIFEQGEEGHTLSDYDMVFLISTTHNGKALDAYSTEGRGSTGIKIAGNQFEIELPNSLTAAMTPGPIIVTIALTHKQTGKRSIAEHITGYNLIPARLKPSAL